MPPDHPLSAVARLVLPASCAGCGRWETTLCEECAALLTGPLEPVEHLRAAEDLDVRALARYSGPVRPMVLGWKNGAREDLDAVVAEAGRRAGAAWATERLRRSEQETGPSPANGPRSAVAPETPAGPLMVVPAPSGLTRRLSGRLVVARLADDVARGVTEGLRRAGEGPAATPADGTDPGATTTSGTIPSCPEVVLSADLLRRDRRRTSAHQAGLSARGRRVNRAREPRVLAGVSGARVLLVDDVVTTGATLGACARALRAEGAEVLGALVLAAAPPPAVARPRVPGGVVRGAAADAGKPAERAAAPGTARTARRWSGVTPSAAGEPVPREPAAASTEVGRVV